MLYLDSGTLTPLLKKLEAKGYIERKRSNKDERNLIISITKKGKELKEKAKEIPLEIHHINGVRNDNRIENLRYLCPNCHALTDTYRGKNKALKNIQI